VAVRLINLQDAGLLDAANLVRGIAEHMGDNNASEILDILDDDNRASKPASLIGRLRSSAFRLFTTAVSMSPHGLVLLFGIGTRALPLWDSRTR
jgi:hypothetical protein